MRRSQFQAQVLTWFDPLPFDSAAALRYGELVAAVAQVGRSPRPRRLDLMIAAVAAANDLALFTSNAADFLGLEAVVRVVDLGAGGGGPPER